MSWGNRVIIILVVFVAGIMSMVYVSMQQTNEVIDSNYYEKELAYQEVIDARQNLASLVDTVAIQQTGENLAIRFPEASVSSIESGKIEFMRLSSSKSDKSFELSKLNNDIYQVPVSSFEKGWYRVRINWKSAGKEYYHEQNFKIE